MSTTEVILLGHGELGGSVPWPPSYAPGTEPPRPTPPSDGVMRGQLVILTRNPFAFMTDGEGRRLYPEAKPDRFFMAELDVLWDVDSVEAERILNEFVAMGGTEFMTGPVRAEGYKHHFPDTNWFGRAPRYADFLRWVWSHGVQTSIVVMTDIAPWYDTDRRTFDWDAIHRDFDPFYDELDALGIVLDIVVSQWEQWQATDECERLFAWMARRWALAKRYWHNNVEPPHLSPCGSNEPERKGWEIALRYLHGLYMQGDTVNAYVRNADGRTPIEQVVYDLWDMNRRFKGINGSPWGGPLLNVDGVPAELFYAEAVAHFIYHDGGGQDVATTWAEQARSVDGVSGSLDGI